MNTVLTAFLLLSIQSATSPGAAHSSLIAEGHPRVSIGDGVIELRGGQGWLRAPGVYLDFRVAFEFRVMSPDSDAGVVIRSFLCKEGWPDRGYRVRLLMHPGDDPSSVLVGYEEQTKTIQAGRIQIQPSGEWQQLQIAAEGRRITIALNDILVAIFEIDRYGGVIIFDDRKGRVQLRNINVASTERAHDLPPGILSMTQLEDAGGQVPKLVHQVRPCYTREALRRAAEGRVEMEVVVLPDGTTGDITVHRSIDPDLDLYAIAAVREWKFQPATLNGKAVPALVSVEMSFRQH